MTTNKDRLNDALRHVHYAQAFVLSTRTPAYERTDVTKQVILSALDNAETHIIRLRAELNES